MLSVQELRSSTKKELMQELERSRKENLKIHIHVKTKHEKDSSKALKAKHYVAQIMTVMKEVKNDEKSKVQNSPHGGQVKLKVDKKKGEKVSDSVEISSDKEEEIKGKSGENTKS